MKNRLMEHRVAISILVVCAALFGLTLIGPRTIGESPIPSPPPEAARGWPELPRLLAAQMAERYGSPDLEEPERVSWFDRDAWKKVVVHRAPAESPLEQVVSYLVPPEAEADLKAFGHGLAVGRERDELSCRSDSEGLNFLALNMADRVAARRLTLAKAQELYLKTATRAASGKSSRFMKRLSFEPYRERLPSPTIFPEFGRY